jgi:hypothetical protein
MMRARCEADASCTPTGLYGTEAAIPRKNSEKCLTGRARTFLEESVPSYDELPPSDLKTRADELLAIADELKGEITFGTREQWMAWELLDKAARYVYNACFYLSR